MNKTIVIVGVLAVAGFAGIYFSSMQGQERVLQISPQDHQSKIVEDRQINSEPDSRDVSDEKAVAKAVVLSAEEFSALQARSLEVGSELDSLTKELDSQLENPERRKSIETQYQKLADEQNMLAIQLVKANQAQITEE